MMNQLWILEVFGTHSGEPLNKAFSLVTKNYSAIVKIFSSIACLRSGYKSVKKLAGKYSSNLSTIRKECRKGGACQGVVDYIVLIS